ncbi:MAG: DUF4286 family protein [Runella sp.]
MILYSVTVNINHEAEQDWLGWMKNVHIPEVMATGLPVEHKFLRLLTEVENEGTTYSCQYYFRTMEDYFTYEQLHSKALQQKHHLRFQNRYVAFRTLLEEV